MGVLFLVVYLYRAGHSVACKTGIMPPFHHHERGQRDGIPPLFLPVGAVGSALAVLPVACGLAQSSRRRRPEATRAPTAIPQAPSGPAALSWPYPHAPLRGLCAGSCAAPTGALRPTTSHRLHAGPPAPGGHVVAFLPAAPLCLSGLGGAGQSQCQWTSYHLSTPICQFFTPSARLAHDEFGLHHSRCDDAAWPQEYAAVGRQYGVKPGHGAAPLLATSYTRC